MHRNHMQCMSQTLKISKQDKIDRTRQVVYFHQKIKKKGKLRISLILGQLILHSPKHHSCSLPTCPLPETLALLYYHQIYALEHLADPFIKALFIISSFHWPPFLFLLPLLVHCIVSCCNLCVLCLLSWCLVFGSLVHDNQDRYYYL